MRRRTANRVWDGERLAPAAYLRGKRYVNVADRDLHVVWNFYSCICQECDQEGRCDLDVDDPAVAELAEYSLVALTEAMSRLIDLHPDHAVRPTPADWLDMVRQRQALARSRELDARDHDALGC